MNYQTQKKKKKSEWYRYWPLYEKQRFYKPQQYSNCLNCGRLQRSGKRKPCTICKSLDVELVTLYSSVQLDMLSTPVGKQMITLAAKALKKEKWSRVDVEYAYRMAGDDPPLKEEIDGPDERVLFSKATGAVLPLCVEPSTGLLFWGVKGAPGFES